MKRHGTNCRLQELVYTHTLITIIRIHLSVAVSISKTMAETVALLHVPISTHKAFCIQLSKISPLEFSNVFFIIHICSLQILVLHLSAHPNSVELVWGRHLYTHYTAKYADTACIYIELNPFFLPPDFFHLKSLG